MWVYVGISCLCLLLLSLRPLPFAFGFAFRRSLCPSPHVTSLPMYIVLFFGTDPGARKDSNLPPAPEHSGCCRTILWEQYYQIRQHYTYKYGCCFAADHFIIPIFINLFIHAAPRLAPPLLTVHIIYCSFSIRQGGCLYVQYEYVSRVNRPGLQYTVVKKLKALCSYDMSHHTTGYPSDLSSFTTVLSGPVRPP